MKWEIAKLNRFHPGQIPSNKSGRAEVPLLWSSARCEQLKSHAMRVHCVKWPAHPFWRKSASIVEVH